MDSLFINISLMSSKLKSLLEFYNNQSVLNNCLISVVFVLALSWYWLFFVPINWTKNLDQYSDWHISTANKNLQCKNKYVAIKQINKARIIGSKQIPPPYPNGWYGILESSKVKAGESTYISCLGEHFVIYRSLENNLFILDAYCPHLGANLGIGGRVVGDNIECPFHQWSFRGLDGLCTSIPYSTSSVLSGIKVRKWISTEANETIFIWYNIEATEMPWILPKPVDVQNKKFVYHGRNEFYINCHIQEIPENGADLAHFRIIHSKSVFTSQQINSFFHHLGCHHWQANWDLSKDKHIAEIKLNHSFKLFNKIPCFEWHVTGRQIGPAYVQLHLHSAVFGNVLIFQTITPVEPLLQKVVHRFYAQRLIAPIMKVLIYCESIMFERDINIWNHKMYRSSPKFVFEDSTIKKFRKWYSQFYTANSKPFRPQDSFKW